MNINYKKFFFALTISVFTFLSGCQNAVTPITPLKPGEMQATVSGTGINGADQFYATNAQVTDGTSTYFIFASVKAQDNSDSLTIHILVPKQPDIPYTVTVANDNVAVVDYCVTTQSGCITYRSKQNAGSVVVKITDISPTVQGTFSGTLPADPGSGGVTISNGAFDASF
jgi:hypothetical protein